MPLSPRKAAERLGLSIGRVRQLIAAKALHAVNVGIDRPVWAIEEQELARFAALDRPGHRPKETAMYIELEAPTSVSYDTLGDSTTIMVGPFADEAAARAAIDATPDVVWEPQRRITGNGVALMARAITTGKGRGYPIAPYIPRDRGEFALLAYQYAR